MWKKLILIILLCLNQSSCRKDVFTISKTELLLDTYVTITLYNPKSGDDIILDEALELVRTYENKFSRTIQGSEVWEINHLKAGEYYILSDETLSIIELSMHYNRLSNGLFDITLGSVSELWDFRNANAPYMGDIRNALLYTGADKLLLHGNKISFSSDGVKLDLGAIAKGYIADLTATFLLSNNISGAVIDLGGDVLTVGSNGKSLWKIAVKDPDGGRLGVLSVSAGAVATSGSYERYFYQDGEFYHHILDPTSGYPSDSDLISVTVLSEKAADADALSSVVFLLGQSQGLELIENIPSAECILIDKNGLITYSSGVGKDIIFQLD